MVANQGDFETPSGAFRSVFDNTLKGIFILKPFFLAVVLISILILALQGCTENPTGVGRGLLLSKDSVKIKIDTLYATSHASQSTKIYTSGSDQLLLGKYSSYDAITMLKFKEFQAATLDTVTVTSATLQLHSTYHFGDSLAPIAFSVYQAVAAWDTASYDSLTLQPGNYYSPIPISALSPRTIDDTSTVQCSIDTGIVNSWFRPVGSLSNYGLVLKASNVSTVKGFGSFNNAASYNKPTLIINYVRNGDGVPGTFALNTGDSRFVASIPQSNLVINPDLMYVQAGVAYRGQLYFNLSSLPKAALILKADLELTLDATDSRLNNYAADSVYCYYVLTDSSTGLIPISSQSSTDSKGRKLYRFAVRDDVRAWAISSIFQSLQFGAKGELRSLDLFTLYGTVSAADVRPRLIITSSYTIQ